MTFQAGTEEGFRALNLKKNKNGVNYQTKGETVSPGNHQKKGVCHDCQTVT